MLNTTALTAFAPEVVSLIYALSVPYLVDTVNLVKQLVIVMQELNEALVPMGYCRVKIDASQS